MEDLSCYEDEESCFGDDDSISGASKGTVKVAREDIKLMNVVRAMVILILLTIAFISCESVFVIATIAQENKFDSAYKDAAQELIDGFYAKVENKLWTAQTLSTDLTSSATGEWPFVTFSDFEARSAGPRRLSGASTIAFAPLVRRTKRAEWHEYAELTYPLTDSTFTDSYNPHQGHPHHEASGEEVAYYPTGQDVDAGMYRFIGGEPRPDLGFSDYSAPIWQMAPSLGNLSTGLVGVLFNEMTNRIRGQAIESMVIREGSVMSQFLFLDTNGTDYASYTAPRSIISYPIYDSLKTDRVVVGTLGMELKWESFLEGILDDFKRPVIAVVDNSCGGMYSYEVLGVNAAFLGAGDLHDDDVDGYESTASSYASFAAIFDEHGKTPVSPESACNFKISVYATPAFKSEYLTEEPDIYRWIVLGVFLTMVMIFVFYDCLVERRQSRVIDAAERSDAIVRSLFPTAVRDRLYEDAKKKEDEAKAADSSVFLETNKRRMKNFMNEGPGDPSQASNGSRRSDPIADLFPNTTVLFADISGFTAWSSEREPSQVFTLLETIYHAMDKAAKKLGVFKVETIGDCYVAATGIPDPQDNHAEIMVRFARSCMIKIHELTRQLEAQLGPGTADLAMRFGIHSGAVTAGVLRGQKARFQLFGDTMNMAARIESSGLKNKIHLSQDTANLLIAAGRQLWIQPRADKVQLKGKGEVQTYWLALGSSSSRASSDVSDVSDELNAPAHGQAPSKSKQRTQQRYVKETVLSSIWKGTSLENVMSVSDVDDGCARLVNWNVDVMLGLLKRVVAVRNASGEDTSPLSSDLEKRIIGQNLVLDEVQMVIPLPDFNGEIADKAAQEKVYIAPEVEKELRDYIACIASGYKKNSFHNFEHASHVILSATKLLKRIIEPNEVGPNQKQDITNQDLHEHTYGIGTDPITQFAVVFSALIHDVGHTGVPNGQLAKEDPALAEKYIHKSVAEQRSVDVAWELLLLPHFQNLRACIYQSKAECLRFRHLVVNSVMATDIFDKELKALRNSRWDRAFHTKEKEQALKGEDSHLKATIVIEHIIQASDVAHTMQHWYIYQKWNERLFKEMYFSYLLGRSEKDPSSGWYEGELWFFDFYVIPLARKLKECGVFGVSSDEYLDYALSNRKEWERQGKEFCQVMLERATKEAGKMGLKRMEAVDEGDQESDTEREASEHGASNDVAECPVSEPAMPVVVAAAPAVAPVAVAPVKEEAKAASPKPASARVVVAPPGKLGIVINTTVDGPVVHRVSPGSAMRLKLVPGDVIMSIDGVKTMGLSVEAITALMSANTKQERLFTVQKVGE